MDNNPIAEITSADLAGKGVTYLPDVPDNLTASELKAKFEEITKDVVIPKTNETIARVNDLTINKADSSDVPDVPEWAMQPEKPSYTAEEVGALAAGLLELLATKDFVADNIKSLREAVVFSINGKRGIVHLSAADVGALSEDSLPDAINSALAQAKASGEFDGADGFSPTIAIVDITGGHRITIADANGTKVVDVMDGEPGPQGPQGARGAIGPQGPQGPRGNNGQDGYTPVKGTDYFTAADKEEIVDEVVSRLESSGEASITIDDIYPVGSIYLSASSTSPASLFGGAWERLKDRFLLGAGETYTAGSTGGEAQHTLTINEMPQHDHGYNAWSEYISTQPPQDSFQNAVEVKWENHWAAAGGLILVNGVNYPHNNMPPYLTVYMWQRMA